MVSIFFNKNSKSTVEGNLSVGVEYSMLISSSRSIKAISRDSFSLYGKSRHILVLWDLVTPLIPTWILWIVVEGDCCLRLGN